MNYFEILGISTGASDEEISVAYKNRINQYEIESPEDRDLIEEAYMVLSDSVKRKAYLEYLKLINKTKDEPISLNYELNTAEEKDGRILTEKEQTRSDHSCVVKIVSIVLIILIVFELVIICLGGTGFMGTILSLQKPKISETYHAPLTDDGSYVSETEYYYPEYSGDTRFDLRDYMNGMWVRDDYTYLSGMVLMVDIDSYGKGEAKIISVPMNPFNFAQGDIKWSDIEIKEKNSFVFNNLHRYIDPDDYNYDEAKAIIKSDGTLEITDSSGIGMGNSQSYRKVVSTLEYEHIDSTNQDSYYYDGSEYIGEYTDETNKYYMEIKEAEDGVCHIYMSWNYIDDYVDYIEGDAFLGKRLYYTGAQYQDRYLSGGEIKTEIKEEYVEGVIYLDPDGYLHVFRDDGKEIAVLYPI